MVRDSTSGRNQRSGPGPLPLPPTLTISTDFSELFFVPLNQENRRKKRVKALGFSSWFFDSTHMRITTGIIKNIRIYVFIRVAAYKQTNDLSLARAVRPPNVRILCKIPENTCKIIYHSRGKTKNTPDDISLRDAVAVSL